MAQIRWRHDGKRLTLPVAVLPSSLAANCLQTEQVVALLDTGATGTGVRKDVATRLGLEKRGRRRIFTANGDILADEHLIRVGFYPGQSNSPSDLVGALPFVLEAELLAYALHPNFTFEMIVGMDILSQMDLTVRRTREVLLELP